MKCVPITFFTKREKKNDKFLVPETQDVIPETEDSQEVLSLLDDEYTFTTEESQEDSQEVSVLDESFYSTNESEESSYVENLEDSQEPEFDPRDLHASTQIN